jgi:hypothetical protein
MLRRRVAVSPSVVFGRELLVNSLLTNSPMVRRSAHSAAAGRRDGRERAAGERAAKSSAVTAKCQAWARRRLAGHLLRSAVLFMSGYLGLFSRKRHATGRIRVRACIEPLALRT